MDAAEEARYTRLFLKYLGITALVVGAVLFTAWYEAVLFLAFAGFLYAIFVRGLASPLANRLHLGLGWSLALVYISMLLTVGAVVLLLGPSVIEELGILRERLPAAIERLLDGVGQSSVGNALLSRMPAPEEILPKSAEDMGWMLGFFSSTFSALAAIPIALLIGFYVSLRPQLYLRTLLHLVPLGRRPRAQEVLDALGIALRRWIIGRAAAMTAVGLLTTIGLWLLGIPLAMTLGLISGLFTFVPYIGPVASAVPPVLLGLLQSPMDAVWVMLLYIGVQILEGYLITPLIQQRAVSFPPAMLIMAQILLGLLFGLPGVILATPLAVTSAVLIQMLYVQDVLGDPVAITGQVGEAEERPRKTRPELPEQGSARPREQRLQPASEPSGDEEAAGSTQPPSAPQPSEQ